MNEIIASSVAALIAAIIPLVVQILMEPKKPKKKFFVVRLEDSVREQFQRACDATDEEPSEVARVCIKAFIEAVERDGEITKPYAVIAKKKLAALQGAAKPSLWTPGIAQLPHQAETPARAAGTTNPPGRSTPSSEETARAAEESPGITKSPPGPRARSTRGIRSAARKQKHAS